MGSAVVEKTKEELKREIEELHHQQWEISERLCDPRGLRHSGLSGAGTQNFNANGNRRRGFAERTKLEDQPAPKRRLSSAVVKIEDGEIVDDEPSKNGANKYFSAKESVEVVDANQSERKPLIWSRRDGNQRPPKMLKNFEIFIELLFSDFEAPPPVPIPKVLPKDEYPSLVKRNKRMLGKLLGTLEAGVYRMSDERIGCSLADAASSPVYMDYLAAASVSSPSLHVVYINTSLETKAHAHELVPTITYITAQIVSASIAGDMVLAAAYSHELPQYALEFGLTNYSAGWYSWRGADDELD